MKTTDDGLNAARGIAIGLVLVIPIWVGVAIWFWS